MKIEKSQAIIRIKDLKLQTIIGCNEWERHKKQDILINVSINFNQYNAVVTDSIQKTINYKEIKDRIIEEAGNTSFHLLEKLTDHILNIIMNYPAVSAASVRVDKPGALSFADSVSVEIGAKREL
jgi:FolB domain-containing protein